MNSPLENQSSKPIWRGVGYAFCLSLFFLIFLLCEPDLWRAFSLSAGDFTLLHQAELLILLFSFPLFFFPPSFLSFTAFIYPILLNISFYLLFHVPLAFKVFFFMEAFLLLHGLFVVFLFRGLTGKVQDKKQTMSLLIAGYYWGTALTELGLPFLSGFYQGVISNPPLWMLYPSRLLVYESLHLWTMVVNVGIYAVLTGLFILWFRVFKFGV